MSQGSVGSAYRGTVVPAHKSRDEMEKILKRVGAEGFRWSSFGGRETLEAFIKWNEKTIAFRLAVDYTSEREQMQKLRALYWYLKSKLEAIEFGLVDIEQEFLPYLLTKGGRTVYEELPTDVAIQWLLEAPKGEP